ncbi:phage virion morphogenesis protein [Lysobacter sp. CA199]|uniref:phage virion morphogenesis protein n=1 Tax=Lysobacter sp. CA199 TaxID=3455608 RepID=UPI003F8D844E
MNDKWLDARIDDGRVIEALDRLERAGLDRTPAMRKIAGTLAAETENNFEAQGRPDWQPLAEVTLQKRADRINNGLDGKRRRRKPIEPDAGNFAMLQESGQLAASVTTDFDANTAIVGSNKVYAAIQQLGGQAGRNRKVTIPARPYLPVQADGSLQPEAERAVLDTLLRHLVSAVD